MQMEAPHPVYELDDVKVWMAMGGRVDFHIPDVGSTVYYYPFLHAAAGDHNVDPGALPNQILATVTAVHLRTTGIDVFAEFELHCHHLTTSSIANAVINLQGGEVLKGREDVEVAVYTKLLSQDDVADHRTACSISSHFAEVMFPEQPLNSARLIAYHNLAGVQNRFFHGRSAMDLHYLGDEDCWPIFRQDHSPAEGELLVVARRLPDNRYWAGIRRGRERSCRPSSLEVDAAVISYNNRSPLRVRYYPNRGPEYVVLASAVEKAAALHHGTAVSFVSGGNYDSQVVHGVVDGNVVNEGYDAQVRIFSGERGRYYDVKAWKVTIEEQPLI